MFDICCAIVCLVVGGDVAKDDIHLILEYKADETWGPYRAPRANRLVLMTYISLVLIITIF